MNSQNSPADRKLLKKESHIHSFLVLITLKTPATMATEGVKGKKVIKLGDMMANLPKLDEFQIKILVAVLVGLLTLCKLSSALLFINIYMLLSLFDYEAAYYEFGFYFSNNLQVLSELIF